MKTHKAIIITLSVLLLSSCTKNYQKVVDNLKVELAQSGDSILAYSIDKRFAVWVHADTTNMIENYYDDELRPAPSVYFYDFDKKEKELLFKSGDSLFCKSWNRYVTLYDFNVEITPDSLGLIIYWDQIEGLSAGLYPLSKRDTVITVFGELANGSFRGADIKDLEITEDLGFPSETVYDSSFVGIEVHYNGNGDVIFQSDSVGIYTWKNAPFFKFPKALLDNRDDLRWYVINSQSYTIGDVVSEARNGVRFKEVFGNVPKYYKLRVTAIQDFDGEYRVDGANFSFFTENKSFALLRYPNDIIIKATVSDVRSLQNNIYAGLFADAFATAFGADRRNPNADFMFKNAELMYYYE